MLKYNLEHIRPESAMAIAKLAEMLDQEALATAMDQQQPDWAVAYANEQELRTFVQTINSAFEPNPYDNHGVAISKARIALRQHVAGRLFMPVRAAVHSHLLVETKLENPSEVNSDRANAIRWWRDMSRAEQEDVHRQSDKNEFPFVAFTRSSSWIEQAWRRLVRCEKLAQTLADSVLGQG